MYKAVDKTGCFMNNPNIKLRLKLQNGMEFEAEGSQEFVQTQKEAFLSIAAAQETTVARQNTIKHAPCDAKIPESAWQYLTETKNGLIYLKAKTSETGPAETALLLLAAWTETTGSKTMDALKLAKSIKKSGFSKGRLDRILAIELKEARIIPSGTKRARNYRLSQEGSARAAYLAGKMLQKYPANS